MNANVTESKEGVVVAIIYENGGAHKIKNKRSSEAQIQVTLKLQCKNSQREKNNK